ncbi:MAG: TonB-dependent receptor plug domain-containing protein [Bacteroidales bacterium]|nr:TonB-dependent receptor plug domain-containing protein [Bacteroidales bacterium]
MPFIPKYLSPLFLIFFLQTTAIAQVDTSSRIIADSSIIYLNRKENIKSVQSQIGIIGKEQLASGYSLNLLNALQGKITGADIKTGTNGNSASSAFFMRGERNLYGSNQPLFIVDGIPIASPIASVLGFDQGSVINDWNMDDIESIILLKGGQAAALYGNRAGNGAILIRTKRAYGKGFHLDYYATALVKRTADYPEFQNKYGQGSNGQYKYTDGSGGGINDGFDGSWGPSMDGQLITQFDGPATGWINGQQQTVRGGDLWARDQATLHGIDNSIMATPWIAQPDNMKNYFHKAWTFANNIGLSWADNQGGVRFSYTNARADDVTPANSRYNRNSINGSLNYTLYKRVTLFGSFNFSNTADNNIVLQGNNHYENPMYYFAWMGRQVNTNSLKNYWQEGQQNILSFNNSQYGVVNPWLAANENNNSVNRKNSFGNFGAKLILAKGLTLNYQVGANKVSSDNKHNFFSEESLTSEIISEYETIEQSNQRHSFFADYNFNIGRKNFLNSFAGLYFEKDKAHNLYIIVNSSYRESTFDLSSTGYYGGISYIRNDAFTVRLTLSEDKYKSYVSTSTPIFYSVSAGLELNKVLHLPEVISLLSLQSGFSKTGLNETHDLSYMGSFDEDLNRFPTISEYTISSDLGLFKNRFLLHANYYKTQTENGLIFIPISYANGYYNKSIYTTSVENEGIELGLDIIPFQSKTLTWKSSISYFKNNCKVIELASGIDRSYQINNQFVIIGSEPDKPMGNLYGSKFERYNGQVIYNEGIPQYSSNQQLLGNTNPDFLIFLNNSIQIKKFVITLGIEYSKGGISYSDFYRDATYAGTLSKTSDRTGGVVGVGVKWDDAGSKYVENDVLVPAEQFYISTYDIAEYSIMDATYLKLKEINIAYSFKLRQKINMTCSIFGQNIFTWSKCKDYNNGNLYFNNNMFYRGINNFNLPETSVLGMKVGVHI